MAYSKTTWVDNTTPIDKDNLNKIEQGIYDNSLVVEAVTNTLNPTDTETYKTAELTEGQITDVIGVSDIIIKGQTEQDGTPTPSAPVDVNVVSGSNVINISNKNLFDKDNSSLVFNGFANRSSHKLEYNASAKTICQPCKPNTTYTISKILSARFFIDETSSSTISNGISITPLSTDSSLNVTSYTVTTSASAKYLLIYYYVSSADTLSEETIRNSIQLELGSTATTYEPHQSKELPLDLPVENLLDLEFVTDADSAAGLDFSHSESEFSLKGTATGTYKTFKLKNKINFVENNQYTLSAEVTGINPKMQVRIIAYDSSNQSIWNIAINKGNVYKNTTVFNPSGEIDYYNFIIESLENGGIYDLTAKIQLEQGSKANAYTPYGTDPIELCKIGDYQDYFYKSGSKWYLHKETIKTIINGSTDQTILYSNFLNALVYTNSNIANVSQSSLGNIICNRAVEIARNTLTTNNGICLNDEANRILIKFDGVSSYNTEALAREYFTNNPYEVIYKASTTTDTEITDTTLISQLEAIYNAPLYEQTNITQENNDLPMVLDITACKDNINGIKAFIRK